MVLSESSRRASSSRKVPVIEISSDSEADTSGFLGNREEEEETNDSHQSIHFLGRKYETENEVEPVSEAEFMERIAKKTKNYKCRAETPTASYSSFTHEEDIQSDNDSTDEESVAHGHQDISGIATRICARGNKHHAVIAKSKSSDTESIYSYSSYCSFSESDNSDDPDYGSTSSTLSQGMGGEKGKEHMSISECMVERVHDEDSRELKKKKSTIEVDPVVKLVHQGLMGGKKGKNHMDRSEWVVERVHDADTQEQKKKSMVDVNHEVERVHDEDTRTRKKKSMVEVDVVVERVHDKDTQERKKKKSMVEVDPVVQRVHDKDTQERKKKSMVEVYPVVERVHDKYTQERKKNKSMVEVDPVVQRVHNKDTQEQKKKSMVEVDPVVERVHDEEKGPMGRKGGKNAGWQPMGRVHEKHVARPESIVEQVHQEPMREEREKKLMVRRNCVVLGLLAGGKQVMSMGRRDHMVEKVHEPMEGRDSAVEREKSVRKCVVELSPNMEHLNGNLGVNSNHGMRDNLSPLHGEEKVHETDPGNRKGEEVMDESVENPAKRSNCYSPGEERDFRRFLIDSLLNESPLIVEDKSSKPDFKLPLKFRFDDDDEIPKPKEKTDYEIEAENLYAVMNNYFAREEAGSLYQQEVKEDAAESSDNGATEDHRCCKEHDYLEDDATGMVCRICQHIGLEAKDIQLRWAEKPSRGVGKRKFQSDNERPREECIRFTPGESSRAIFLNPGDGTVWDIKPGVRKTMYKHQQEGFEFLWKNMAGSIDLAEIKSSCSEFGGCIISHAPGTGKTRLTMMFVETYLKLFPDCRPVIIAPSSMLLTWEGEFRKWNVEFPFNNLNNPEVSVEEKNLAQRLSNKKAPNSEDIRLAKIHSWTKEQSVLGMSYNLFAKLVGEKRPTKKSVQEKEPDPELKRIFLEKPGLVVLDEGHIPRNQTSSIWNALLKLRTEKRVVLSGTPFQNNFRELFNVMQVARPSFAISIEKDPRFADMISSNKKKLEAMEQKDMDKAILELKTAMAPYVNMYNDSSFLQSKLPGLRDFLLILKPTALQKRIIEEMERPKTTFELEAKVALVSVHPSLFNPSEKEKLLFDEAEVKKSRPKPDEGVKTRFLMELVRISMARNEKVLVFSQYIEPLLLLQQHLCKGFNWGDSQVLMIKGKMDQKQRQKLMASFNNPNDEAKVLLASTKCCSEGVSLVGASRVVLLDVVWNPAVERQAISRAYRIGQTKIVYTYHLMASGTSEMDKYRQQAEKDRLSEMVFAASSAGTSNLNDRDEAIEDIVLEKMVANVDFQQIFDKVTYQPKQRNQ